MSKSNKKLIDCSRWSSIELNNVKDAKYRVFWTWLLERCDVYGIWEVNWNIASLEIGFEVNEEGFKKSIPEGFEYYFTYVESMNGTRWFIPSAVKILVGEGLSGKSPTHARMMEVWDNMGVPWNKYIPVKAN